MSSPISTRTTAIALPITPISMYKSTINELVNE